LPEVPVIYRLIGAPPFLISFGGSKYCGFIFIAQPVNKNNTDISTADVFRKAFLLFNLWFLFPFVKIKAPEK